MELIAIELSEFTRRSRSVLLHAADLALDAPLAEGERVVLWDSISGDYHSGTVLDADQNDGTYRFDVGIRLPDDLALARLTGVAPVGDQLSTNQVLDLLGSLREQVQLPGALSFEATDRRAGL
ncbi:hypothetical protein [Nocardioides sp. AE5]|uniref:hypothetical protein n=1 Tax=Nocardioides sp. AE5 TaxID=2962573 RepID=UPI002880C640|nr:hypothetical protein [Nocardioides sp. AE5]MDT0203484.1 hypothetical protein [Nocardioides sp. AE5]